MKIHGFSRDALAQSVLHLPKPHEQPLSDAAVTSLFGDGDDARRTMIKGWMALARENMRAAAAASSTPPTLRDVLGKRLQLNEEVLPHLSEVSGAHMHAPSVASSILVVGICTARVPVVGPSAS